VRGGLLAALTAVWLAGRIAVWAAPSVPLALAAVIDIAFIPFLAAVVLPALLRGKGRNLVFMVVLGLLTVANLLFHLEAVGIFAGAARGTTLAVDSIALLIAIIGGRVTPAFTANVLRFRAMQGGPQLEVTVKPWLNQTAIASIAAVIAVDLVAAGSFIAGLVALAAAALNGWRMAGWQTAAVLRLPIMWVLARLRRAPRDQHRRHRHHDVGVDVAGFARPHGAAIGGPPGDGPGVRAALFGGLGAARGAARGSGAL
jgi:uncharacterized protein involved in response to NO